jgi:hypothetical protein
MRQSGEEKAAYVAEKREKHMQEIIRWGRKRRVPHQKYPREAPSCTTTTTSRLRLASLVPFLLLLAFFSP